MSLNTLYARNKKEKTLTLREFKSSISKKWLSNPYHNWILENSSYKNCFETLINSFNLTTANKLLSKENILFHPSSGILSCTFTQKTFENIIILYPDLLKLMRTATWPNAVAILTHEIGHIVNDHSEKIINPLKAQIEADYFAFQMGFGEELQNTLIEFQSSPDIKTRISQLSIWLTKEISTQ